MSPSLGSSDHPTMTSLTIGIGRGNEYNSATLDEIVGNSNYSIDVGGRGVALICRSIGHGTIECECQHRLDATTQRAENDRAAM